MTVNVLAATGLFAIGLLMAAPQAQAAAQTGTTHALVGSGISNGLLHAAGYRYRSRRSFRHRGFRNSYRPYRYSYRSYRYYSPRSYYRYRFGGHRFYRHGFRSFGFHGRFH